MEKITVLLVEDEQTLAMIIKDTLEGQNFIIHTAADGEEGLRKFFDLRPDVLVADVMMPRMDGFEKLEQMPGIKLVPLFIKNAVVNLFNTLEAKKVTLTISNMGRIPLQKELQPYIKGFTAFCSSTTAFTTVCSYGDDLVLGTTWAFRSTEMLKNFYRRLSAEGLDITLYATEVDGE
jgi:hypothetical protein